jgi:hypothetical protein
MTYIEKLYDICIHCKDRVDRDSLIMILIDDEFISDIDYIEKAEFEDIYNKFILNKSDMSVLSPLLYGIFSLSWQTKYSNLTKYYHPEIYGYN